MSLCGQVDRALPREVVVLGYSQCNRDCLFILHQRVIRYKTEMVPAAAARTQDSSHPGHGP